jgi:hypothetical protein
MPAVFGTNEKSVAYAGILSTGPRQFPGIFFVGLEEMQTISVHHG